MWEGEGGQVGLSRHISYVILPFISVQLFVSRPSWRKGMWTLCPILNWAGLIGQLVNQNVFCMATCTN